MVNAQEWLNQNYPNETRGKITDLDISGKGLEDDLILDKFTGLVRLNCF